MRKNNEDSYLSSQPVAAVADGMGGYSAGEVASAIAIEELAALGNRGRGRTRPPPPTTSSRPSSWPTGASARWRPATASSTAWAPPGRPGGGRRHGARQRRRLPRLPAPPGRAVPGHGGPLAGPGAGRRRPAFPRTPSGTPSGASSPAPRSTSRSSSTCLPTSSRSATGCCSTTALGRGRVGPDPRKVLLRVRNAQRATWSWSSWPTSRAASTTSSSGSWSTPSTRRPPWPPRTGRHHRRPQRRVGHRDPAAGGRERRRVPQARRPGGLGGRGPLPPSTDGCSGS